MSDVAIDARAHLGSAADREPPAPSFRQDMGNGGGIGLVIALSHFAIKCYAGGHWHYVPPDDALIEMASPTLLLPIGRWVIQLFGLIGDIIMHKLRKADT